GELAASRERGAWDRWAVQTADLADGWVLFEFDQRRIYAPLEHQELPHQFARIATGIEDLPKFVNAYGRLGWYELISDESGNWRKPSDGWFQWAWTTYQSLVQEHEARGVYAEPLDWIVAHARTISWCLEAAEGLRLSNARARATRCADLSRRLPAPVGFRGTVRQSI